MTTTDFRDTHGQLVGIAEVDSRDELTHAVIKGTFQQRWVVDVGPEGATCRTCDHECDHPGRIESMLQNHGLEAE